MMPQELSFRDLQVTSSDIVIRKIGWQDIRQSLKEGYDDFNAEPSFVAFLFIVYPLFALLLTLVLLGDNLLYLAFPIVAGFTLLGPIVSVSLFEMSRRREEGPDVGWRSAFEFVHSSAFAPIVALSLVMMALYVLWIFMAQFIFFGVFGAELPGSIASFANEVFSTRHGAGLIIYGTGIGFLFAFTAFAISVFAFPLLLDKPTSSITAISTSMRAVISNPLMMAVWAAIVVVSLAAGALLFLVGLAAVLPILGHATWHLYRKVIEP
ncbi:MAG: DUF2189 domain-containing protein [Pseudomonadales bacterium]